MSFILSLDQGTTGTTAVLVDDKNFKLIDKVNKEFTQIFPNPGEVEHDLNEIWKTIEDTTNELLKRNNISPESISAIGITNQRETTCAFNKKGEPLANAIVWQDRRTANICADIINNGHQKLIKTKTGLPIDPYFSGSKMKWLLENNEHVQIASQKEELLFGTIDTFLLYKLTGNIVHATEASNASRTLLMNLGTCQWDEELLDIFQINDQSLPLIKDSWGEFGKTKGLSFLPDGIPISGILGDQQAALFGQAGFKKGDSKCTYGTGAFMLLNIGEELQFSENGLLTTVAYKYGPHTIYALEGSTYIAGAAVQWLRDNLKIIDSAGEIEELAKAVKSDREMENILFLPFFTGLGSPYWISDAQAALVGLTRDSENKHIARACLEGIALSINDLIESMKKDSSLDISELKVDGGAVANKYLMEIQATISNADIIRPQITETTVYGAALTAALGIKKIELKDISKLWKEDEVFLKNSLSKEYFEKKKKQWSDKINKLFI